MKKVGPYLETESDANRFVEEAVKLKLKQRIDFTDFDESAQMGRKSDHSVLPGTAKIS